MMFSATSDRIVYATSGALATVGFFLPWMTYKVIGMPDGTVTISTWSGWNITLPVGLPALVMSVVTMIVSIANVPLCALWLRLMTLVGLLALIGATALLLPDDQSFPLDGPLVQLDYGLILTYIGYAGMLTGSFVLAGRSRQAPGF